MRRRSVQLRSGADGQDRLGRAEQVAELLAGEALELDAARERDGQLVAERGAQALADDDLARARLAAEAAGEVDDRADDRTLAPLLGADLAEHEAAGGEADAHVDRPFERAALVHPPDLGL